MHSYPTSVEKWGLFEFQARGKTAGNPFTDYTVQGTFTSKNETVTVSGFYDGEGIYKIRFMPSFEEAYTFTVSGSFSDETYGGSFLATAPSSKNHGPVRAANTYHFAYEDGTPYYPIGTTCYVWELQSDEQIAKTLQSLKEAKFNKIRFCIFPKHYDYNLGEPRSYPYEGTPMDSSVLTKENFLEYTGKTEGNHWDFTRFHPAHFQQIERCIAALQELGVEADLIVMHPYDRWGFSQMTAEQDDLYWNYVINRFSAYRNVWWALANEYDLMEHKTLADWERYAKLLCDHDPYGHLRSIHNSIPFTITADLGLRTAACSVWICICLRNVQMPGEPGIKIRLCWMRSLMKAIFSMAGAIFPHKSCSDDFGRLSAAGDIPGTGRRI